MDPILNIAAVIVFVLGGLGTLRYAWAIYRKNRKEGGEKTRTTGRITGRTTDDNPMPDCKRLPL